MRRASWTMAVIIGAAPLISACDAGSITAKPMHTSAPAADSGAVADAPAPPAEPSPDGTYRETCDYELGDFSDYTDRGFRFTGDAVLTNTGNVGTVDRVDAVWHLSGGRKIAKSKTVRIPAGKKRRVSFLVPTNSDSIDAYQAIENSGLGASCNIKVTITDTFGTPTG